MLIQVITLFPEMFPPVLETSMLWKAKDKGIVEYRYINLRDFGLGPRKSVDDTPYGGGDGMLLRPEPLVAAIEAAKSYNVERRTYNAKEHKTAVNHNTSYETRTTKTILMTPRGKKFTQAKARQLSACDNLILVCARYEGYDERVTEFVDEEISIGDYVLTGGELPAMVVIDGVVRLIPGVLGGEKSAEIESFSNGKTLEYPQYTRPEDFRGMTVPGVLLSGNHANIETWRKQESDRQV